ncbi:MAG: ABC-F family ATP-binding cassette domain-containing protein [Planctomycetes bacterium]|nr:ABC-F family ATP-binding cassette domain-containing protein [Planctomycetota bacterium]
MAVLVTCQAISKHFGTRTLFDGLSISFAEGERVGFLGPNGAGKTTFLRMLADLEQADGGEVNRRRSVRIGFLPQEDRFSDGATVASVLEDALADQPMEPYERDTQVAIFLSKFGFETASGFETTGGLEHPNIGVEKLSGGWRKRLALAREMIQQPDLLLMDEPTNHLDLEGIQWLEKMLLGASFSFVAVSHDRYFLEHVTNRVVELNPVYPDGYFSVSGGYSMFLEKRADFLESQQAQQVTLANIVRREVAFLKSNSKAQRTKSKSRVEEAYRLKDELRDLSQRNARTTAPGIDFGNTGRKTKKLLDARGLSKTLGGKLLFKDVSIRLSPGVRVGLLGANGSGKTTLIRVLTGALSPDEGSIELADGLRIVVFDQNREELPQDVTLRYALAGNSESVEFRGRTIHIGAWARRFLFSVSQLDMPVGDLSGGEQARILIARLMLQPADVLVLDEPTNDLDITSLDVLEESLTNFPGAVVLVTHDRFMLERVCTEILGLDGLGRVGRYVDCAQWQAAQVRIARGREDVSGRSKANISKPRVAERGLTASEEREHRDMEATILEAEDRVQRCIKATEDPAVGSDHVEAQKRWEELESARKQVAGLYVRWEDLDSRAI